MATVEELVSQVDGIHHVAGSPQTVITGITHDSRAVKKGSLFVALPGGAFDGHRFIDDAIAAGAAAVLVETDYLDNADLPQPKGSADPICVLECPATRPLLGFLGAWFYRHPSRELVVLGLTGTNGKTTTSYLLEAIFRAAGHHVGVVGTIAYRWAEQEVAAPNTTPDGLVLQKTLRQMADDGVDVAVLEVSSHGLANARVAGVEFDGALFTNLSRDHLDFHDSMEEYRQAKWRLFFDFLPSRRPNKERRRTPSAIINTEHAEGQRLARALAAEGDAEISLVTTALDWEPARAVDAAEVVQFCAQDLSLSLEGLRFECRSDDGAAWIVEAPLPGRFNAENVLGAVAMARQIGVAPEAIARGLARLEPIPGRMERVNGPAQSPAVFVDYAHTPDALAQALETLRPLVSGRLWVVFGCGGDRDATKRAVMGQVAARLADQVVITNDNPRQEPPAQILDAIAGGLKDAQANGASCQWQCLADRRQAIGAAIAQAEGGDVVLIAGKGHETYQERDGQRRDFDDRQIAAEMLIKWKGDTL